MTDQELLEAVRVAARDDPLSLPNALWRADQAGVAADRINEALDRGEAEARAALSPLPWRRGRARRGD